MPGFTQRVAEATPDTRDRAVDGLRALAILGVVGGHWLVTALTARPDGSLRIDSPLRYLGGLAPASWLLQTLGLFFLVGGFAAARSASTHSSLWVRRRLVRLGAPVLAATTALTAALAVAALAGVPGGTLRTWTVLFVQPLWFIAVYAAVTALTPYTMRLDQRLGALAALPFAAAVAVVDLFRYGPWADAVPASLGYLTVLPAWLFTYQLGVAWARGRLGRRAAWGLLGGGAALFAALLGWLDYPASMVGVPGADRSNSSPPSLLVPALAAVQAGAALLLRERFDALLRRRARLWAAVAAVNLNAMRVFCWHLTAVVVLCLAVRAHGLTDRPAAHSWVLARAAWLPVLAAVLAGLVALARRIEALTDAHRMLAGAVAMAFAAYALTVY
ncbi:acyltransferase family protein [Phytohabitans rumicis]|uniref:Membrane protein n=1 Tax=Phytohabitans rumicis TaxID=1076125 RepID=A0A6V8KY19_9ACTN|nr:acyltransferase [Phytohabitans rumicis]GFJ88724.1 membrane protein [Phytohabitans rumicis]